MFMEATDSLTANKRGIYEFTVTLTNECTLDVVGLTTTINDFPYFIGGTAIPIEPTYSNSVVGCPVTYGVLDGLTDSALNSD